jgi:hypothetical protein
LLHFHHGSPTFAVSSASTPPPAANTRKHTHSEIPLLLYEEASGDCFFGSLGAVSQGQDKEQLLSWMNDSHPKFLTFILKMLQGIVIFWGLWLMCPGVRTRSSYSLGWMIPIPQIPYFHPQDAYHPLSCQDSNLHDTTYFTSGYQCTGTRVGRFFDSVNNRLVSEVKKGQIFFSSRFFKIKKSE